MGSRGQSRAVAPATNLPALQGCEHGAGLDITPKSKSLSLSKLVKELSSLFFFFFLNIYLFGCAGS